MLPYSNLSYQRVYVSYIMYVTASLFDLTVDNEEDIIITDDEDDEEEVKAY